MYTGHVALALGARGLRRDVPLWALALAAQGCDWVEVVLRVAVPRHLAELWSHAFPYVFVAAAAAAVATWAWRRSVGGACTVLLLYLSHPIGDYVTGYKVLWQGAGPMGLILFERPMADFLFQGALCLLGWALYWNYLPRERRRRFVSVLPVVVLLVLQALADVVLSAEIGPLLRDIGISAVEIVASCVPTVA